MATSFHSAVTQIHTATFSTDLRPVSALSKELIPLFIHSVIDSLCLRQADFSKFQANLKCRDSDIVRLKKGWCTFIRQAYGCGLKGEHIVQDLVTAGLDEAIAGGIKDIVASRSEETREVLSRPHCERQLRDFDWRVNLTVASHSVATAKNPVCLLSLDLQDPSAMGNEGSGEMRNEIVELTRGDLNKLIGSLENANQAMQQVSSVTNK